MPKLKHVHELEFFDCSNGETTYKCKVEGCNFTHMEYIECER